AGTRLFDHRIHVTFRKLLRRVGIEPRSPRCRPRLHDLRHTFAVRTLLGWSRRRRCGFQAAPALDLSGSLQPLHDLLVPVLGAGVALPELAPIPWTPRLCRQPPRAPVGGRAAPAPGGAWPAHAAAPRREARHRAGSPTDQPTTLREDSSEPSRVR